MFHLLIYIYKIFLLIVCQFVPINLKKYGKHAIITGASDGIGKEYAKNLARKGLNVILIARSEHLLQQVCQEIEEENHHKIWAKYVIFDFSSGNFGHLQDQLAKLIDFQDLAVLVNNVGIATNLLCYPFDQFTDLTLSQGKSKSGTTHPNFEIFKSKINQILMVNCQSVSVMTAVCLNQGFLKKPDPKGFIINISSIVSQREQFGFTTLYSSTKAYVSMFSNSIMQEMQYLYPKIQVQTVTPGFVLTKLVEDNTNIGTSSGRYIPLNLKCTFPDAAEFVKSSCNTIGYMSETYGYIWHEIVYPITKFISSLTPSFIWSAFSYWLLVQPNIQRQERKKLLVK